MKKRMITAACLALLFHPKVKAQNDTTTVYKKQKLKIEEVNFISSYYTQQGDNSAVTVGKGTEKLTDIATNIEVVLTKKNAYNRTHQFNLSLGVDSYTSASSDKIDPNTVSSASYQDVRVYPSAQYAYKNDEKKYIVNAGLSFSAEYDYFSSGVNVGYAKNSKNNNREFSAKASVFLDTWKVILPVELRNNPSDNQANNGDMKPRNSYNLGLTYAQVVTKNFQLAFMTDIGYQQGLLGTKFNRVYFDNATVASEKLPDTRFKLPAGVRANYFLGDNLVLRSLYRYYTDTWAIQSHTFSFEPVYKINAFSSIALPYRFYTQTQAKYFKAINQHVQGTEFYTSDFDLSQFSSHMLGLSYHKTDNDRGIFNSRRIHSFELRYGYYSRNNGLQSHIITLALQFK